jgi:hypothetical protein
MYLTSDGRINAAPQTTEHAFQESKHLAQRRCWIELLIQILMPQQTST